MSVLRSICEDLNIPPVTSKLSYGGGYSVPKHPATIPIQPQVVVPKTINQAGNKDLITSIDRELVKMRSDSSRLAEFRVKFEENLPTQDLSSLQEIEKLRLIHQEKLKVIEEEYNKNKIGKDSQQHKKTNYLRDDPFIVHVQRKEIEEVDERETLLRWLFGKLDVEGSGLINKQSMIEEIEGNEQLSKYFQVSAEDIERLLPGDFISQNDFLRFFLSIKPEKHKSVPAKNQPKQVRLEQDPVSQEFPVIVLKSQHLQAIEKVFKEVDIHNDMAVQKFEFLQSLRTDDDIIKMLNLDAIEISKGTFVTLETVLDNLQDSEDLYDYITYSQFLDLILNMYPKQIWIPEKTQKKILLDSLYQQILLDVFDSLPRKSKNLVSTYLLIKSLREDPQVKQFLQIVVKNGVSVEGIFKVVERDAGEVISWEDFLMYFSEDGKPEVRVQDGNVNRSNFYALKEDFVKLDQKNSPPPVHSKPFNYQFVDTFKKSKKKSKSSIKFTVPVPFAFDSRDQHKSKGIKQLKFEQYINEIKQQEENHLKYRPVPVPVPAEVIVPKYNTLIAAQEHRRNEVKQNSKKLTKEREKPFDFYLRELNKPKQEEIKEEPYKFKAKAPPASNSIPLYEQMSRKMEEDRKSRIEAAAKKALEESKLPPRMEKYAKDSKNLSVPAVLSTFKAKKPPEFTKLWENLGKSLNKKKDSFQPTVIKEFKLTEGKSKSKQEDGIDEELAKKGFLQITKKVSEVKEMDPTKKQVENDESGKKRREELRKADEEKRQEKERREILEELQKKRLEEKKQKAKEKVMQGVKDRPPIEDAISSEYSKINSGTRVLTTIKQKMQKMGIKTDDIIGETDNFIDVIAEDLV